MIAKLTGTLDSILDDAAVIDVGGVGYLAFCSSQTLRALPPAGSVATLLIETHVREDHIHLFGFATAAERDWFRLLMTVQGVGAKVALAVLSALSPDQLTLAITAQDPATLTRANGVGRKVAQRIVTELKDKAGELAVTAGVMPSVAGLPQFPGAGAGPSGEAISALVNLGYRRMEATGAIGQAMQALGADASTEALIKAGLQELAS
ncbi:MAG: Holliday junction branch migration protein RuvA [Alphaproteobacteria bacterium]|nr:Holliday junction branch migration protein RuvA [Alphaproteobacteria bacterium]